MTQIDEFESLFKSASKPVFHIEPIAIRRVMVVLDEAIDQSEGYVERVESFLKVLSNVENKLEVMRVTGDQYSGVGELLDLVNRFEPDLICTYRNLHIPAIEYPYSLGVYIDVLTQATSIPVLLMPRPDMLQKSDHTLRNTDRVMAVTDHLAGDAHLVTYAALFTQEGGELTLAHIEDEQTYIRYMDVISKIPTIETDLARDSIKQQLLKEPTDYIASCKTGLQQAGLPITVKPLVSIGHHLSDYRSLIGDTETDLLVFNTKDEDQLAMHGLAYPLSIEFRDLPLLLI